MALITRRGAPANEGAAQIMLGKYHKREDFRIEVRLPSSSANWGKESPCIWKNPVSSAWRTEAG
ncbi:hypothetical protein EYF80_056847 [Liparis tanakae]|uniref:Uncharacterized protein n=1 Tax=Liparis tanakae TaxID=230148 RepID=A0A4Z2EWP2_9TELE|nr:hypothetical protein EYF80_056847 [Liparis tanakae]